MSKLNIIVLLLSVLFIFEVNAANPVGLKSVGATGGILLPQDNWENGFAVEIQTDLGEIIKYIFLIPHFGYWHAAGNKEGIDLSYTNIYFGTKFIGYFNTKPRGFYAGLGIQYHIIDEQQITPGFDAIETEVSSLNLTRVGYSVIAGYLLKLKKISFSFEPRYTLIPGADNMISISLGASYLLP